MDLFDEEVYLLANNVPTMYGQRHSHSSRTRLIRSRLGRRKRYRRPKARIVLPWAAACSLSVGNRRSQFLLPATLEVVAEPRKAGCPLVEQGAQATDLGGALLNQVRSPAQQIPQLPGTRGFSLQRAQPAAVQTHELGDHEGVDPVVLAAAGAEHVPGPLGALGLDRKDGVAAAQQPIGQCAVVGFDADAHLLRSIRPPVDVTGQLLEPVARVGDGAAFENLSLLVHEEIGVVASRPIQSDNKHDGILSVEGPMKRWTHIRGRYPYEGPTATGGRLGISRWRMAGSGGRSIWALLSGREMLALLPPGPVGLGRPRGRPKPTLLSLTSPQRCKDEA